MESNYNYNFNSCNEYYTALECVIFGEGTYLGVDPKTAINMAKCCNLFYNTLCYGERANVYWKKQVINQFKYKIADECKITNEWKNLFCDCSNELNKLANQCFRIFKRSYSEHDKTKINEMLESFSDSLSHPHSNAKAQYCFATSLMGSGEENFIKAFEYYKLSADQGFAPAQNELAQFYSLGFYFNGQEMKDKVKGFEYYQRSANQGNAEGQCSLGSCYLYGWGVEKDETEAFKVFQLAANQNNAGAQHYVAQCYRYGWGVIKNTLKAFEYYNLSAINECYFGSYSVAECYEKGIGVDQNLSEAIKHYKMSAAEGNFCNEKKLAKLERRILNSCRGYQAL